MEVIENPAPNRRDDRQIDRLVYELYGLTEEEIAIVEDGLRRSD